MNISNINLKCDGTLPKGKFLECTEQYFFLLFKM